MTEDCSVFEKKSYAIFILSAITNAFDRLLYVCYGGGGGRGKQAIETFSYSSVYVEIFECDELQTLSLPKTHFSYM